MSLHMIKRRMREEQRSSMYSSCFKRQSKTVCDFNFSSSIQCKNIIFLALKMYVTMPVISHKLLHITVI